MVIAARGKDFTVGLDLREMADLLSEETGAGTQSQPDGAPGGTPSMAARAWVARASILRLQRSISSVAECPKPVIAAVHGHCIGGGVDLIAACDIRLASSDASFSVRETRVAIVADLGSLQRLPRIIGAGHVAELAFTGRDVDAERAQDIGLVNNVFSTQEELIQGARALAGEIAGNSPLVVQGVKAVLRASAGRSVADGLDYVAAWNAGMLQSDDLVEAMMAFMEKRSPEFRGR